MKQALIVALALVACVPFPPPPPPPAPLDMCVTATCTCERLCSFACADACDARCVIVLDRVLADRVLYVDVACVARARSPVDADACAGVRCAP